MSDKTENIYEIKSLLEQNKRLSKRQEMWTEMSMTCKFTRTVRNTYTHAWKCSKESTEIVFRHEDMSPAPIALSIADGKMHIAYTPLHPLSYMTAIFDSIIIERR